MEFTVLHISGRPGASPSRGFCAPVGFGGQEPGDGTFPLRIHSRENVPSVPDLSQDGTGWATPATDVRVELVERTKRGRLRHAEFHRLSG